MYGFTSKSDREKYGKIIADNKLGTVLWSEVDTYYDIYKQKGTSVAPQVVADYVSGKCKAGDIILIHFSKLDINALALMCDQIAEKGLKIVTVSKLLKKEKAAR